MRNSGTDLGGNTNDVKSSYEKQTGNQSIIAVWDHFKMFIQTNRLTNVKSLISTDLLFFVCASNNDFPSCPIKLLLISAGNTSASLIGLLLLH